MSLQVLKRWASELIVDTLQGNSQRRPLIEEEFLEGWGRNFGVSNQQMNQLMFLLTSHAPPVSTVPYLNYDIVPLNSETLKMEGQTLTEEEYPQLFSYYGSSLPDINTTDPAPTGFSWVVRAH